VVVGAVPLGDQARVAQLVGLALGERHEKVFTWSSTSWLITAVIAAESMPPERNMPNGTSAMRRTRTASRKRSSYPATRSFSGRVSVPSPANDRSQYWRSVTLPSRQVSEWPGGSRRTPAKSVSSPDGAWLARKSGSARQLSAGRTAPASRSALISLAK
jgi:hypothetical protein